MALPRSAEITGLLRAWSGGDEAALDRLTLLVYDELRLIARRYMHNERADHTLQTTALVNEAWLRLIDIQNVDWKHRAQFFGLSAQLMRRILVDAARTRGSHKRGGAIQLTLDDVIPAADPGSFILALHEALETFAAIAPRQAKVVELRYFGGLNEDEAALVLKTTPRTVRRDWQFAKA